MEHGWILEVIDDVEAYAHFHQLHNIKARLAELRIAAEFEIAAMAGIENELSNPHERCDCNVVSLHRKSRELKYTTAQNALFTTVVI